MLTITTTHKLSKADIVRIFADLVLMRKIAEKDIESITKDDLTETIEHRLKSQGISTWEDWYDTDKVVGEGSSKTYGDRIKEIKAIVTPIVDQMFKD